MVAVTPVDKVCTEPSANLTVTVTPTVLPNNPPQPELAVADIDTVLPGRPLPVHVVEGLAVGRVLGMPHPLGRPVSETVLTVVVSVPVTFMGTSPVFFNTSEKAPAPVVGDTTSLTESMFAVGLLPAIPARLKKTPEITTAAATVIAISRITASKGLKPTDVFLLISTTPLHFSYL
jgi:hypothetical protein